MATQASDEEDRCKGWDYLIEFHEPLVHDPAYIGTHRVTVFAAASHLAYRQAMSSCHAAHPNASQLSVMEATRLDWRDTLRREDGIAYPHGATRLCDDCLSFAEAARETPSAI